MKKFCILAIISLLLVTGCGKKEKRTPFGKINAIKGSIEVYNPRQKKWTTLSQLTEVFYGDSIRTGGDSELEILFEEDNSVKLAESTVVYLQQTTDSSGKREITVSNGCGKMLTELKSVEKKGINYVVLTPTARAVPKGTHFMVYVTPITLVTQVTVLHGHVHVYHLYEPIEPVVVEPGYYTVVTFRRVPLMPVAMNYGQFKKMHRVLGPRAYGRYSKRFKIHPQMKHSAYIVGHRRPGKLHIKGRPGPFKGKAKLGPGKGVKVKQKVRPVKVKQVRPKQKKAFKAKVKGKGMKGKMKRK